MSDILDVIDEVKKVVEGKDECVTKVLAAILAGGHILIEDVPGVGKTTLAVAFSKAMQLFDPLSTYAKVIVIFTDGKTTAGSPPSTIAAAARAAGIIIYCIGLIGSDGIDINVLNDWATDPNSSHVAITPDDSQLEQLFKDLAANIAKPGATDIVIEEVINSDFVITSVIPPLKALL